MSIFKENENLIEEEVLKDVKSETGLDERIIKILFNRGYNTKEKIDKYLFDNINNLKDPFLLINMENVTKRIEKAIKNNEEILIFGDYDVDGICASSILYNYLKEKTEHVKVYLPNRFEDGYGLTCPCIDKIAKKQRPDLIITVDCGISCANEVDFVKNMGIDIIVTDHHVLPETLPNCLTINPKFKQKFDFEGLCGAGVAFKLVQALCYNNGENFEKYLPLAALATIADIVPLTDENRIIVKEGLKRLEMLPVGVKFLLKKTFKTLKDISSTNIAFKIAPKINSAGRLDDATIALKLFISDDLKEINKSLVVLESLNEKRKSLCDKIFEEAKLKAQKLKNNKIIILYDKNWDIGVLGIVCAKLCEEFGLPVVLFGENEGELKGSCRTVGNIDAVKIFENAKDILINFGGHQKAGGLSLKEENLLLFEKMSNEFLNKNYNSGDYVSEKKYDLLLTENEINVDFVKSLSIFEPCGFENSKPIFKINLGAVKVSKMPNCSQHLMIKLNNKIDLLSFNDEKNYENYQNFNLKTVLAELEINKFKNIESVKGIVKYSYFDIPNNVLKQKLLANYLKQLETNYEDNFKPKFYTSLKQIENIIDNKTIFLSYDYKKSLPINKTSFCVNHLDNQNLLFGIKDPKILNSYHKIIFMEKPIEKGFAQFLSKTLNSNVYLPLNDDFAVSVNATREEFLNVYFVLVKAINKNICAENEYNYFEILQTNFGAKFNFVTFFTGLMIFKELKIIEQKQNINGKISYKLNKIKTDLTESKIFQKLKKLGELNA